MSLNSQSRRFVLSVAACLTAAVAIAGQDGRSKWFRWPAGPTGRPSTTASRWKANTSRFACIGLHILRPAKRGAAEQHDTRGVVPAQGNPRPLQSRGRP